jgi:hypothetical protein
MLRGQSSDLSKPMLHAVLRFCKVNAQTWLRGSNAELQGIACVKSVQLHDIIGRCEAIARNSAAGHTLSKRRGASPSAVHAGCFRKDSNERASAKFKRLCRIRAAGEILRTLARCEPGLIAMGLRAARAALHLPSFCFAESLEYSKRERRSNTQRLLTASDRFLADQRAGTHVRARRRPGARGKGLQTKGNLPGKRLRAVSGPERAPSSFPVISARGPTRSAPTSSSGDPR